MKSIFIKKLLTALMVASLSSLTTVRADTLNHDAGLNSNDVLIFVSFSMPINSLKAWSAQAQKIHAPLIIRGLVNDSFVDTQKAVKQVIGDQPGGVMIDPRFFKQYKITQVPAVVIHHQNNNICLRNQSCWQQENFDLVAGDVGLESALEMIGDRGDNAKTAQRLLSAWRST